MTQKLSNTKLYTFLLFIFQILFLVLLWQNANDEMLKIVIVSAYAYSLFIIAIQVLIIFIFSKIKNEFLSVVITAFFLTFNFIFFVQGFSESFLSSSIYSQVLFSLFIFFSIFLFIAMIINNLRVYYSVIIFLLISIIFIFLYKDYYQQDTKKNISKYSLSSLDLKFDKKPDVFVIIYDSMIPKKSAKLFLNIYPDYYGTVEQSNARIYENSFVERIPTRPSLKIFMGLGNDDLPYGMINGQHDSPLASIFRNNGYKITTGTRQGYEIDQSYKSPKLQGSKSYIDEYHYDKQELFKASPMCINIPKSGVFSNFERFYYFCSIFSWLFDVNQNLEGWPIQVLNIINDSLSIDKPSLTILYLYHPIGHTGVGYSASNESQKKEYIKHFNESSRFLSLHLEKISKNIFSDDKNSFLLVFGDHGTFAGEGNYQNKNELEVLDKYGVFTALYGDENNCARPELLEKENNVTSPTKVIISLIDCLQTSGEKYMDTIEYNIFSEIEEYYGILLNDLSKLEDIK